MSKEQVLELLKDLGSTPEEIAATLEQKKYHGVIGNPDRHPVGLYLAGKLGYPVGVGLKNAYCSGFTVPLPHEFMRFTLRFDKNEFPELVK